MEIKGMKTTIRKEDIPYALPSNWHWFYWEDLIESYDQGLIRSNNELSDDFQYEYLKMDAISIDGSCSLENLAKTNATVEEEKKYKIKKGDFFINVRNSKELVGKNTYIKDLNRTVLYNHMLVKIKHKYNISGSFINAFLNIPSSRKLIERCKRGTTTVIALYQKDLYKIPIAIPDSENYKIIVNAYEKINEKIELNKLINAELEAMAKTIYDYWFVQFDFPDNNGKPYKSNGGKMIWNEELKREIPEGWEVSALLTHLDCNLNIIRKNWTSSVIKYLDTSNLTENCIDFIKEINIHDSIVPSRAQRVVKKDDILISTVRPNLRHFGIIKKPIENMIASTGFAILSHKTKTDYNDFFYMHITSDPIQKKLESIAASAVSSYPSINPSDILGLLITLPSDFFIVKNISKILSNIFLKVSVNQQQNQQLSNLRDWLLPMLMNGQVTVGKAYEQVEKVLGMVAEDEVEYKKDLKEKV